MKNKTQEKGSQKKIKSKQQVVEIDLSTNRALHDSVTIETWDYIYNRAKADCYREFEKIIDELVQQEDLDEDLPYINYYELRAKLKEKENEK